VIGRTTRATRARLLKLIEMGLVAEIGSGPNEPQWRSHVAEDPALGVAGCIDAPSGTFSLSAPSPHAPGRATRCP
jgi:hypothetical protein